MPTYDLALDASGDIYLSSTGDLAVTQPDKNGIAQHIAQRLKTFRGELAWAPTEGVPYFQIVFVKGASADAIRAAFATVIKGTPGVKSLDRLDLKADPATRTLTVGFSAQTDAGLITSTLTL